MWGFYRVLDPKQETSYLSHAVWYTQATCRACARGDRQSVSAQPYQVSCRVQSSLGNPSHSCPDMSLKSINLNLFVTLKENSPYRQRLMSEGRDCLHQISQNFIQQFWVLCRNAPLQLASRMSLLLTLTLTQSYYSVKSAHTDIIHTFLHSV